jgi:hypothetical protein
VPKKKNTTQGKEKQEPNTLIVKKDIVYYRYTKDGGIQNGRDESWKKKEITVREY